MNKISSGKLILPFSVVAFALVLVVGGILLLRQISESQPTPTPSPTPTAKVPTDWLTYRNEEFGFEMGYPSTFSFMICTGVSAEKPSSIGFDNKELIEQDVVGCDIGFKLYGIVVDFQNGPYSSTQELIASLPLGPNDKILSSEEIYFGENKVERIARLLSSGQDVHYFIQYPESNLFLLISVYMDDYDEVVNQILLTLKFIRE